ncbi:MAG TPA: PAS domain S-box protein, partial [Longimicrobiales bacterium]|nr:PAS domain S-box protein [Longimicrobiales bacterium]
MTEPADYIDLVSTTRSPNVRRGLDVVTRITALAAVLIGAASVASGLSGDGRLGGFERHLVVPPPAPAFGLILAGVALWCLSAGRVGSHWRRVAGWILGATTAGIGLLLLVASVLDPPALLDWMLSPGAPDGPVADSTMRPVPGTAVSLIAIGMALILLDTETRQGRRPAQYLALIPAFFGLATLAGPGFPGFRAYGEGVPAGPAWAPVSLPIAVAFLTVALGLLASRPDTGWVARFTGGDVGGFTARRLLPVAFLAPILAAWMGTAAEQAGLFGPALGTTLVILAIIATFAFVVTANAATLTQLDVRRRGAEERLRESEERFRLIFEEAGTGIALLDGSGCLLAHNPAFRRFTGRDPAQLQGVSLADLAHPEDAATEVREYEALMRGECGSYRSEKRYVRGDGAIVWGRLTASIVRDERGRPRYGIALIADITDQKRYDEHRSFLLEASRILSSSLDVDAVIRELLGLVVPRLADAASVDLLEEDGITRRYRVGKAVPARQEVVDRLVRLPPPEQPPPELPDVIRTAEPALFRELTDDVLVRVSRTEEELELMRALQPRTAIVAPLRARGRVIGTLTMTRTKPAPPYEDRDMFGTMALADRAALAIDNARLLRNAHDAMRVRDEVLRIVAHDLRNPLNSISLALGVLRTRSLRPDDAEADRYATIIDDAVVRANRLIHDLLDVARMAAGRLTLDCRPVDPIRLVHDAVESQRAAADEKSVRLEV